MTALLFHQKARELIAILVALFVAGHCAASTLAEWQQRQPFEVPAPGLISITLLPATLDALRPGLEDLRLADAEGRELPFLVQRPEPEPAPVRAAKSFKPSLRGSSTVLEMETGLDVPINAVTLETPEREFIKAVRVEGSRDGRQFTLIAEGVPVFRQGGVSELSVRFSAGVWPWLRLSIDDQRARPVPFTGAWLHAANGIDAVTVPMTLPLKSREEIDGDTRLVLDLGSANLTLASIDLDTPEALFQREISARVPSMVDEEIHEVELRRGFIYALDASGVDHPRSTRLVLDRQIRSRELVLLIRNLDSPPLAITAIRASRRPVKLVCQARNASPHFLYAGNNQCPAPRYDLTELGTQLKSVPVKDVTPGALVPNPDYRASETLPGLSETGAALDTNPWRYRKRVLLTRPGVQQLELDLDVLAQARQDLGDVRLLREGRQVSYLIERTSIARALDPVAEIVTDPRQPRLSTWKLTLPKSNLPVARIECRSRTGLFQRTVRVWEEVSDDRGGKYRRELGRADWRQAEAGKETTLPLNFTATPRTTTLYLETDNGDNPAVELDHFRLSYPVTRLVFKSSEPPTLYYGNAMALAPRYDLSLVAAKLLGADKASATLGAEEILKRASWTEGSPLTGLRGWVFWGVLCLVTAGLIVVIIRLLPTSHHGSTADTTSKHSEPK